MRVLITGGSGFIGRALVVALVREGHDVSVLSRSPGRTQHVLGNAVTVAASLEQLLRGAAPQAVVNLAGESIAQRPWTRSRRAALRGSRIDFTYALVAAFERCGVSPAVLVNASAIGFYGVRKDDVELDEGVPAGSGFAAQLCADWEQAAATAARLGTVVSVLRIGLVLGRRGGVLPPLVRATRFGVGAVLGDGRQWQSWIHLDDLLTMIRHLLQHPEAGAWNAVAPTPVRQREFADLLAMRLHRPRWLRVPAGLLRGVLGELADELLLSGPRVLPRRAVAAGLRLRFADLDSAFRDLL